MVRESQVPIYQKQLTIVSGGQTGVDRAALDLAIELGIPHGGWCPKGRLAEDGRIASQYCLKEMETSRYSDRTKQNVIDSDGTLILYQHTLTGGTLLTAKFAESVGKPLLKLRLDARTSRTVWLDWLRNHQVRIVNVAGPRESTCPGVYTKSREKLRKLIELWQEKLLFDNSTGEDPSSPSKG